MFGYIRAAQPELKVRELELYKAVYCSLCRCLGKSYGVLSRFTLSYDFTFLALLRLALMPGCDGFERKRCAFNPLKKCNYCKNSDALEMPASAAMIMLYYKLTDDIADEKGVKRLGCRLLKPVFSAAHKKAARRFPQLEKTVSEYISAQNAVEQADCRDIDRAADPTARALSEIFALCSEDEGQKRVLDRLGYCLGRYIYLLDAACDLEKDVKNGSYNVLRGLETKEKIRERIEPQLYFCINEAGKAFELLKLYKYEPILGNIIYLGLEETFKKELNK